LPRGLVDASKYRGRHRHAFAAVRLLDDREHRGMRDTAGRPDRRLDADDECPRDDAVVLAEPAVGMPRTTALPVPKAFLNTASIAPKRLPKVAGSGNSGASSAGPVWARPAR